MSHENWELILYSISQYKPTEGHILQYEFKYSDFKCFTNVT